MPESQPSAQELTLFYNATKVDSGGLVERFWMLVESGRILTTGSGDVPTEAPGIVPLSMAQRIDVAGNYLVPGFIDLHCHGGGGFSFDGDPDEIKSALKTHRAHGTTRSILSLVANPISSLMVSLEQIADLADDDPTILGSHLEGPFLSDAKRGAHNPAYLINPDEETVEELIGASRETLRQVTIAPELDGAFDAIEHFSSAGITVAVGHTDANFEQTVKAFDRGATLLTHAFNAMNGIHHRNPGPIPAAFDDPRGTVELILDGIHVHPSVAEVAFNAAKGRVALVTDAMAAAGAEDGEYRLGSLNVTVSSGKATISGTETIAGSTLTLDLALRNAVQLAAIDLVDAVSSLTLVPARVLGLESELGNLEPGKIADAIILNNSLEIEKVWIAGTPISH